MDDKPMEFKARIIEVNGRKTMQVQAQTEIVKRPDGKHDVIIHAPSLSLMAKHLNTGGK